MQICFKLLSDFMPVRLCGGDILLVQPFWIRRLQRLQRTRDSNWGHIPSCNIDVFFIRNKSHSFCAVKTVHLQEVKQNIINKVETRKYKWVFSTCNSRYESGWGRDRGIGRDKGNWLVVHTELLTRLSKTHSYRRHEVHSPTATQRRVKTNILKHSF